ncbi:MAG: hypothetical protein C0478_08555 [Planctomyces sp.]|nr:hypothetical protein [Planctomyces sp.]
MAPELESADATGHPVRESWKWLVVGWLGLFVACFVMAPIPAVNETHYLGKARHFFNPAWCAGDPFLESPSVHVVFFASIGWLAPFFGLTITAIIARAAFLWVLAWGLWRLGEALGLPPAGRLTALWVPPLLVTVANVSGEWIVGGAESKTIAYGCLFAAMAAFIRSDAGWRTTNRRELAACASLLAWSIAWHPIVGIWGTLVCLAGGLGSALWWKGPRTSEVVASSPPSTAPAAPPTAPAWLVWIILAAGWPAACWAMLAAFQVSLAGGASDDLRFQANFIQVYYRLAHHLDPMVIPRAAWMKGIFATLLATAAGLMVWHRLHRFPAMGNISPEATPRATLMRGWGFLVMATAATVLLSAAGYAIGYGPRPAAEMPGFHWRMLLLKFYPFRLADVFVPLLLAFSLARLLTVPSRSMAAVPSAFGREWLPPALALLLLLATGVSLYGSWEATGLALKKRSDWLATCEWVFHNTPRETLCFAPTGHPSFKWYADRPEYVSFKDCPQDPQGIVDWNNRLLVISRWLQSYLDEGRYTADGLRDLHALTGLRLFITDRIGPFDVAPVYENDSYRVYALP